MYVCVTMNFEASVKCDGLWFAVFKVLRTLANWSSARLALALDIGREGDAQ